MELRINLATSCVLLAPAPARRREALEILLPSFPRGKKRLYQWPSKDTNLLDPTVGDAALLANPRASHPGRARELRDPPRRKLLRATAIEQQGRSIVARFQPDPAARTRNGDLAESAESHIGIYKRDLSVSMDKFRTLASQMDHKHD